MALRVGSGPSFDSSWMSTQADPVSTSAGFFVYASIRFDIICFAVAPNFQLISVGVKKRNTDITNEGNSEFSVWITSNVLQASKPLSFVNTSWVTEQLYTADVVPRHYCLCPQNYF